MVLTCWEKILLTITIATTIISCNHVQCIGMKYDYLQSVYFRPKEGNIRSLQPCNLLLLLLTIFCIRIACLFPFGELFLIRPEIYQKKLTIRTKQIRVFFQSLSVKSLVLHCFVRLILTIMHFKSFNRITWNDCGQSDFIWPVNSYYTMS